MRHENFVVFHNDSNSSYMNSADNFRGAEIGAAQEIDIYFESALATGVNASYDRVRLHVKTAGDEEKALEAVAGALQGNKSGLTVMADDKDSVYFSDFFDAVTSFTTASLSHRVKVESITPAGDGTGGAADANTRVLTSSDSGTTFFVNCGTNTAAFRLPAVANNAGVNFNFIMDVGSDNEATKDFILSTNGNAENIMGVGLVAGALFDFTVTTSAITLDGSEGTISGGDRIACVCDGTNWYITEASCLTASMWVKADNAI